jgi:hypothetical protein
MIFQFDRLLLLLIQCMILIAADVNESLVVLRPLDDSSRFVQCVFWHRLGLSDFCRQNTTTTADRLLMNNNDSLTKDTLEHSSITLIKTYVPGDLDWCEYWRKVGDVDDRPECAIGDDQKATDYVKNVANIELTTISTAIDVTSELIKIYLKKFN